MPLLADPISQASVERVEAHPADISIPPTAAVNPPAHPTMGPTTSTEKDKRAPVPTPWIMKPAGSSQGRGIHIVTDVSQIPQGNTLDNSIIERYINNPLLIDGYKFDLRLYVAVTGFEPLKLYLHKEGLARFATEPYSSNIFDNRFSHLTNYSINKKNKGIRLPGSIRDQTGDTSVPASPRDLNAAVQSPDPDNSRTEPDLIGSRRLKLTLDELEAEMRKMNINTEELWMRIEDVIVKTLISVEMKITTAVNMFVPNPGNTSDHFYMK
jgi:tubulin polyglutamylase TTLL5